MRCACYARFSSDLQRQTSIDDQLAVAQRYAEQRGWAVLDDHQFTDKAVSGISMDGRPGIQSLLEAAQTAPKPFDVLLVDDSSRVARDLRDALYVMRELKFAGVRTIYISQQIDSDDEQAETLLTVHGLVDGLYLREMSKKITRGLAGQLQRGFSTGAKTYGYRSVKALDPSGRRDADGPVVIGKRLEVDPVQADVIRQIFQWYLEGVSHPKMVDRLNAMPVPTPRGTRWTKHHTERILKNERYLGRLIWGQGTLERRPGTNRRVRRPRPPDEWQIAEHQELRIVDDDVFQRVAARRKALTTSLRVPTTGGLARGRSGLQSTHLVAGLSRCGTCGKAFTIVTSGHGSPRYGCPNSWHNGRDACDNRLTIMAKVLEPLLLQGLRDQLLAPAMLTRMTDAVTEGVSRAVRREPDARQALQAKRDGVATKLDRLIDAIEQGTAAPAVTAKIATREAELRELDAELAAGDQPVDVDLSVIPTWVRQQVEDLAGLLADTPERAKAELHRLGMQFTVSPVRDDGRPFLRVEGVGNLDALCGTRDLPSTGRRGRRPTRGVTPIPHDFSTRARSLGKAGQARNWLRVRCTS